jgi:hypothetical protein
MMKNVWLDEKEYREIMRDYREIVNKCEPMGVIRSKPYMQTPVCKYNVDYAELKKLWQDIYAGATDPKPLDHEGKVTTPPCTHDVTETCDTCACVKDEFGYVTVCDQHRLDTLTIHVSCKVDDNRLAYWASQVKQGVMSFDEAANELLKEMLDSVVFEESKCTITH